MNPEPGSPVYFKLAVRLLIAFLAAAALATLLFALNAASINRSGGWGWLLLAGGIVLGAALAFLAAGVCAGISLLRREPRRNWSIALLVIGCLSAAKLGKFCLYMHRQSREAAVQAIRR